MREDNPTRGLPVVSPAHMVPVQVVERTVIAPDTVSVSIVLPGTDQAPAPYLPGQFVTLALPTPRETLYRSYSLCGAGNTDEPWEITVKRMDQGAVSTYFYQWVREGTLLYSSLPRGTFTLPAHLSPEMALIFVAAGSGITPIMGMLRALAQLPAAEHPLVQLHYASKSPDSIIFGDELEEMDRYASWLIQRHYLSSENNRMTADTILPFVGNIGAKAHWYMCGPEQLKRDLQTQLSKRGVPKDHVHSEIFATQSGPSYRVEARGGSSVGGSIVVQETGATLDVQPQETLLTALERHGYRPEFSCRVGACGACKLKVVTGQVDPIGEVLSTAERRDGYVLGCLAHPIGDVTIASGGRPPAGVARVAAFAARAGSSVRHTGATSLTRVAALVGAGVLLLGSWNLTNHRPLSWSFPVAPVTQNGSNTPTTAGSPSAQPGTTRTPGSKKQGTSTPGGSGSGGNPTATSSGSGGGTSPTPTTSAAPTATPKPTPKATCTPTPSKPSC